MYEGCHCKWNAGVKLRGGAQRKLVLLNSKGYVGFAASRIVLVELI